MVKLSRFAIVSSADGRVLAFNGSGRRGFSKGYCERQLQRGVSASTTCELLRVSRRSVHLICMALDGRVRWRTVGDEVLGPFAAGPAGIAILIGRSMAWFKTSEIA